MDLEEAQEKGWSGILVYHEMFNDIRKYEIAVDEKNWLNLMCEMRGDLLIWCPDRQLLYTTNLKCLHSNPDRYKATFQELTCTNTPFGVHRLLPSPSDKHVALIGDDEVNILELQRHRGPHGEFGGGDKTVNCKCTPIDQDYFVARKQINSKIVLHAEWINEYQLAILMSDETIRGYSVFDLNYPSFAIPLEKGRPSLSLRDKFVTFGLLPAPLRDEDDATLLLIKSNGDVHLLSIRQNKEFLPVTYKLSSALPMLPGSDDNYEMSVHEVLVLSCFPPVVVISTNDSACYHCILLPVEDHQGGEAPECQLLVYDRLQQEKGLELEEEAGLLHQGAELLANTSCNYQYYIIDGSGIQRITLLWAMNITRFMHDSDISLQPMFEGGTGNSEVQHLVVTHPLMQDSPVVGQLVCGICCISNRMLGHVLVAITTEGECITLPLRQPHPPSELHNSNMTSSYSHAPSQPSLLEEQVKAELSHSRGVPIISIRDGAKLDLQQCYEMLCESTKNLQDQHMVQQGRAKQLLTKRMESLLRQRRKQEDDLQKCAGQSRVIAQAAHEIKDRVEQLQLNNEMLCNKLRTILCNLEMASPELSEIECNAQKELKEMTNKLKRLQNEIKVCSVRVEKSLPVQDQFNWSNPSLASHQLTTVHQLLGEETSRLTSLVKNVKELEKHL